MKIKYEIKEVIEQGIFIFGLKGGEKEVVREARRVYACVA
jgi:hypothetical protein